MGRLLEQLLIIMNKKGFTLVELLAVLIVLGVVITITATTILKQVNESRNTLSEAQINLVKNASVEYADRKGFFKKADSTYNVCIDSLKSEGLIDDSIISNLGKNKNYFVKLSVKCDDRCYFEPSDLNVYSDSSICNQNYLFCIFVKSFSCVKTQT